MIESLLGNHSGYSSTMGGGEGSSDGEVVTGTVVKVMAMTPIVRVVEVMLNMVGMVHR